MKTRKIIEQTQNIHNILEEMQFTMKKNKGNDFLNELEFSRGNSASSLEKTELKYGIEMLDAKNNMKREINAMIDNAKGEIKRMKVSPVDEDLLRQVVREECGDMQGRVEIQSKVLESKANLKELFEFKQRRDQE